MFGVPEAKVIADSIAPRGHRITTMEVKMHRFVLAEFNTHREFSRNSASSRAIPVKKMLERVKNDPAVPLWWGKNQSGMSARTELDPTVRDMAIDEWLDARDSAVKVVESLQRLDVHKQIANRLLEPFMWHTAIITSTDFNHFFSQRCHEDAQPEMKAAADAMQMAYFTSTPKPVDYDNWYLPFDTERDHEWAANNHDELSQLELLKRISVARCARVSYLTHDGVRDPEIDLDLYNKLASAKPMHASPFEHIASPAYHGEYTANFRGWRQYRSFFDNEYIENFVPNHPDLIS